MREVDLPLPPTDPQGDLFGPPARRKGVGRPVALPLEIEEVIVELWPVRILTVPMIQIALLTVYGRWVSRMTIHRVVRRRELPPRCGANEERRERPRATGTPPWYACAVCGHRSPTPTHDTCKAHMAA